MAKTTIENKIVTITHNTRCSDTPAQIKGEPSTTPTFTHAFDFSEVKEEQILQWAGENRLIAWRAKNKPMELTKEELKELPTTIDCNVDFAPRTRKAKVDPLVKVLEEMAVKKGISVEELMNQLEQVK